MTEFKHYAETALKKIKKSKYDMGLDTKGMYLLLYNKNPTKNEEQALRNRLNRGNPNAEFIGLCVSKMPSLQNQSMFEFFNK